MEDKIKELICENLEIDTLVIDNWMSEDFKNGSRTFEELEEGEGFKNYKTVLGFLPNTSITIDEITKDKIYVVTYIDVDGNMIAKVGINYNELIQLLNDIAKKKLCEDYYVTVFNIKDGLGYDEFKKKILELQK